jgi:hypothetical protein
VRRLEPRHPEQAIQIWSYYANAGGNDKDRMVVIATWLLTLSAGIVLYFANQGLPGTAADAIGSAVFALLGAIVAVAAGCLIVLYGGYANSHWLKADAVAEHYGWNDLLPEEESATASIIARKLEAAESGRGWLANRSIRYARSCKPAESLAPVFVWFFWFAFASLAVHLSLLSISIARLWS